MDKREKYPFSILEDDDLIDSPEEVEEKEDSLDQRINDLRRGLENPPGSDKRK